MPDFDFWNYLPGMYQGPALGSAQIPDGYNGSQVTLRLSYYWPPLAYIDDRYQINCDKQDGRLECIHMASGADFRDWIGKAVACPAEWPFGSRVAFDGMIFECQDRGGAIVCADGVCWIDILYPVMPSGYNWGQVVQGGLYLID